MTWTPSPRLALVLALVAVTACNEPTATPDPVYTTPIVGVDDVDDRLTNLVAGERRRVLYTASDPSRGAAAPLVTIVVWSDFQCPFCGRFAETLDELVRTYPEDVRIVAMQYPLPVHPQAHGAARAVIAAQAQGRFWAMHDRLFSRQGALREDALEEHARALGLDMGAFKAALVAPDTHARVDREIAAGHALGVTGTPTFFVNGLLRTGSMDPTLLAATVDLEREMAEQLITAGSTRAEVYARIMRAAKPPASL